MSALEKLTNFILNNPASKAISQAFDAAAEWIANPPHVRAMLKTSRILQAARDGDIETVKKALKKEGKIDYKNEIFISKLLCVAAENGQKEIVQMLLDRGASAVSQDWQGIEPAEAATKGGHFCIVELLYNHINEKGLPPTDKLKNAFTLAQDARTKGHEVNSSHENSAKPNEFFLTEKGPKIGRRP
jgi:ankyrin repeat protein